MRSPALLAAALAMVALLAAGARAAAAAADEAYVTLLYGDEFVLGVRVLGKSIRDTGTHRDMVVLVSDGVSEYSRKLFQADGWIVKRITLLANPNQVRPKRFWGVYTKLKIFNMTSYKKVVYLDADTVVVKSIEDLFKCGKFCGNLKHSERMNSGVMVVEPSESLFNDMISQVGRLPSYTGGDQGFLNSYYSDFANSHVYEPDSPLTPEPETQRLSTLYNADVGLYMLANKWMVDEKELRVIHYTLGPLKPWDWWTVWLVKPVEIWQDIRQKLEESLPGTGGGRNPHDQLVVKILFIVPLSLLLFGYYQSCFQTNKELLSIRSLCAFARRARYKYKSEEPLPSYSVVGVPSSAFGTSNQRFSNGTHSKLPSYFGAISVLVCFISAGFSLAFAFAIIPRQVMPWTGLLLMFEWTFVAFFLIFGSYLRFVYRWGSISANHAGFSNSDSSENHMVSGHQRNMSDCDMDATFYWIGMAAIATVTVLLPTILGITALFTKLGLMVAGGVVLASFMTYASEHLAISAFHKGQKNRNTSRTRSFCFLC
ncbi:inositol phosphorylceramide glucuronosyltransferase 1-like isoform X1 [Phragmites australis]|uniref:inositol phosphorylceramide glucuronosyltransferase 1-like isoform X1 n=1 Tax=Phragmites australis TaxID=29695 RepID=UPI002D793FDB|nr:inositol phosphorylceramide glucuronosyltransferase 1-like isoform X1 [Phragmites australis]